MIVVVLSKLCPGVGKLSAVCSVFLFLVCVGYAQSLEASSAQAPGARSEADIWEHDGSPVLFGTGYRRRERDRLSDHGVSRAPEASVKREVTLSLSFMFNGSCD